MKQSYACEQTRKVDNIPICLFRRGGRKSYRGRLWIARSGFEPCTLNQAVWVLALYSESSSLGSSPVLWIKRSGFEPCPLNWAVWVRALFFESSGLGWGDCGVTDGVTQSLLRLCISGLPKKPIPGVSLHTPDIRLKCRRLVPFDFGSQTCFVLFLPGQTVVKIPWSAIGGGVLSLAGESSALT